VFRRIPEPYAYCQTAYSHSSSLFFSPWVISDEGAQQDDPIDSLFFSNTLHATLPSLEASLILGYLDDITLGSSAKTVAAGRPIRASAGIGLSQCIQVRAHYTQIFLSAMQSLCNFSVEWSCHLTGRVHITALDSASNGRYDVIAKASDRLSLICIHDQCLF